MVYICSVSNLILVELNTGKESLREHEENALLPLDLFSGLHEFINVQKKRKPYRGPCNDK